MRLNENNLLEHVYSFILMQNHIGFPMQISSLHTLKPYILCPYTSIAKHIGKSIDKIRLEYKNATRDGFVFFNKNIKKYMIGYNDTIDIPSQRYIIAHEIAHFMLGHIVPDDDSVLSSLYRYASIFEEEANFWAINYLCPPALINFFRMYNVDDISHICNVPKKIASGQYWYVKRRALISNESTENLINLERKIILRLNVDFSEELCPAV